jgi:hypothetical protein
MAKKIQTKSKIINSELCDGLPPQVLMGFETKVWPSMVAEGRHCRKLGFPIDYVMVKLLASHDMAASWRLGWELEDRDIAAAAILVAAKGIKRK